MSNDDLPRLRMPIESSYEERLARFKQNSRVGLVLPPKRQFLPCGFCQKVIAITHLEAHELYCTNNPRRKLKAFEVHGELFVIKGVEQSPLEAPPLRVARIAYYGRFCPILQDDVIKLMLHYPKFVRRDRLGYRWGGVQIQCFQLVIRDTGSNTELVIIELVKEAIRKAQQAGASL